MPHDLSARCTVKDIFYYKYSKCVQRVKVDIFLWFAVVSSWLFFFSGLWHPLILLAFPDSVSTRMNQEVLCVCSKSWIIVTRRLPFKQLQQAQKQNYHNASQHVVINCILYSPHINTFMWFTCPNKESL